MEETKRVRIYLNDGDVIGHRPAHERLLEFLHEEGAAGTTVFRAVEGFGGSGEIHTARIADVAWRLPIVLEWVDDEDTVRRLLDPIKEMANPGLIIIDTVEVAASHPRPVHDVSRRLRAADVMSHPVVTVAPDTPLKKIVELILGKVHRSVPVIENGKPIGIITNSDLIKRGGLGVRMELLDNLGEAEREEELKRLHGARVTARDVMTPDPVTVRGNTLLRQVASLLAHRRLKRIPVVDEKEQLVGILSRLDLLRTVAHGLSGRAVTPSAVGLAADSQLAPFIRTEVAVVHPETPLTEVFQALISTRLNRALVVDNNRHVVGLVTDEEALDRVTPSLRPSVLRTLMQRLPFQHPDAQEITLQHHARATTAKDLMTTDVATVPETATLQEVTATMVDNRHKVVAIVDKEKRFIGVVDRADILRALAQKTR